MLNSSAAASCASSVVYDPPLAPDGALKVSVLASVRSTSRPSAPANVISSVVPALSVRVSLEFADPDAVSAEIEYVEFAMSAVKSN